MEKWFLESVAQWAISDPSKNNNKGPKKSKKSKKSNNDKNMGQQ